MLKQEHGICFKSQSAFKKYSIDKNIRTNLFNLMIKENSNMADVVKEYFKSLSLKKKIIFKLKQILPIALKSKLRFMYHKVIR